MLALAVAAAEDARPVPAAPPAAGNALLTDAEAVDEHQWTQAASRRRQHLATAPQAVTVLDVADLSDTPAATLPDRLRFEPGVDVIQTRHGQYDVGMRGYNGINNSRILALVDGREFRWESIGSIMWIGYLHPSDISRVEIAKGPSSVTYGANAFGGAVLISDREVGERYGLYTVNDVGSDGRVDLDATALGPLPGGLYFKTSAGGTELGDLDGPRGVTVHVPHPRTADSGSTDFQSTRWAGTLGWRLPYDVRLEAEYHGIDVAEWESVEDFDVGSNHTDWTIHDGGLRLVTPYGELRHIRQWADYDYSNQKTSYVLPDFRYAQAGWKDVKDTTRVQLNLTPPNHALTVGGEYMHLESRSNLWVVGGTADDEATWGEKTTTNRALFVEDQYALAPAWVATGGLRVDDHSLVGVNWSPRAAVNWIPDDDQFWLLSYSRGYRIPNAIESYIQEYYFESDPDLDAETINALELGWQRRFGSDDLRLGFNGFVNRSNGSIWIMPLSGTEMQANYNAWLPSAVPPFSAQPGPYFRYQNLDNPITVLGSEASASYRWPESPLRLWANGTWQRARYQDEVLYRSAGFIDTFGVLGVPAGTRIFAMDTALPRDVNAPPEWMSTVGVSLERRHLFATLAGRVVSGREVFSFANSSFPNGRLAVQRVPSYVTCDLTVGIDFDADGSRQRYARLAVLDLFDATHHEWYRASSTSLASAREEQLISDLGRSVVFQVGWLF